MCTLVCALLDANERLELHAIRDLAQLFADELTRAGFSVLNDVVLNQVLVAFGDEAVTNEVIRRMPLDGTCWCGETVWKGRTAMRISVSSYLTTAEDVQVSARSIKTAFSVLEEHCGGLPGE
ncbi:MAG: hypothetical protein ACJ746_15835 [Bryobacteraceae bacterium]